jgi:hypothetical protein
VPFVSSTWIEGVKVRTMMLPIGAYATGFLPKVHGQLWDSPPVLQLFREVFGGTKRLPFLCAAADSDDYIDPERDCRVRVSAIAPDGGVLPNLKVNVNLDGKRMEARHLTANTRRSASRGATFAATSILTSIGSWWNLIGTAEAINERS